MLHKILTFFNLALAGLLVGAMFGIWLGFNPAALSAGAYVEQQQNAIRGMNVSMPILGAVVALLTLVSAIVARTNYRRCLLFVVAFLGFTAAGLVTRFLNQPINAVVITWTAVAPPENWADLRDEWWHWHLVRTGAGLIGFSSLIAGVLIAEGHERDPK